MDADIAVPARPRTKEPRRRPVGSLPTLRFEKNVGQAGPHADAIVRARGYTLTVGNRESTLRIVATPDGMQRRDGLLLPTIQFSGTNRDAELSFVDDQPGVSNYLLGSDPGGWRTAVPGYSRVKYAHLYPDVDVVLYGNPLDLEYDFVVAPGGNPSVITFEFPEADWLHLDDSGDLLVTADDVGIRQKRPDVYQKEIDGTRRTVGGSYALEGKRVRFHIGDYDPARPLVIDPVLLVYSTYIGGAGSSEFASGLAVDAAGSAYITSQTRSWWYPTANALQPFHVGWPPPPPPYPYSPYDVRWWADDLDVVISKFAPDGSTLLYSTYIGGASADAAWSIAVDDAGEAVVMGTTGSTDFPSAPGYQFGCPCPAGFFLLKLNASGTALRYVARMRLWPSALAVDGAGNAYLAGSINGPAAGDDPYIPIVNAQQPQFGGGNSDAYLIAVDAAGTGLLYSTYLGGEGNDSASTVAVLADGRPAVAGATSSVAFPMIAADAPRSDGPQNTFAALFTAGGALQRAYFLQGPFTLTTGSPTFGGDGSLYVVGTTGDDGFPAVNAMQPLRAGQLDGWIVKYSTSGAVVYSTYVGGPWPDVIASVAPDAQGRAYIFLKTLVNWTQGPVFMGSYPDQPTTNWDVAVVKLHSSGELANAVRLGGSYNEAAAKIAAPAGDVYLLGTSHSVDFPLVHEFRRRSSPVFSSKIDPYPMDMILVRMSMKMGPWPVTTAVTPGSPQRITIRGEEFSGAMRVFIGGQWATDLTIHDRHTMTVTVPALPAGLYDIVMINSYGEIVTKRDAILYGTCTFQLESAFETFLPGGGARTVQLTADVPICGWAAESSVDWVSFQTPDGVGSASVRLMVQPNPTAIGRTATVTIGGQHLVISQRPATRFDINHDGVLDLIWQHLEDGRLAAWAMNGPIQIAGSLLTPSQVDDPDWKVVGTGDFDYDGEHDLVWQHIGDGRIAVWRMNGLTLKEGTLFTPPQVPDLDWRIRAVGDLNGDGSPDLIWHHRVDGRVGVWLMEGVRLIDGQVLGVSVPDIAWQIVGAGDFTGPVLFSPPDGHLDLVWQHRVDGRVAIWTMDGLIMTGGRDVAWWPGLDWKIRAIGDISGDNELDFVLQHETGALKFVRYNPRVLTGVTWHDMTPSAVPDTNWVIVGPR